jgi:drug/metabolite transporter superfamily protein YnfA
MLVEVPSIKWLSSFDGKCLQQGPTLHENLQKKEAISFLLWWSRGNFVTLRNVSWITLIYGGILFSLVTYNMILSHDMAYGGLYVTMIMQFIYLLLNLCCNQNDNDTSKYLANFWNKLNTIFLNPSIFWLTCLNHV